jgi:hypothetical protein
MHGVTSKPGQQRITPIPTALLQHHAPATVTAPHNSNWKATDVAAIQMEWESDARRTLATLMINLQLIR